MVTTILATQPGDIVFGTSIRIFFWIEFAVGIVAVFGLILCIYAKIKGESWVHARYPVALAGIAVIGLSPTFLPLPPPGGGLW